MLVAVSHRSGETEDVSMCDMAVAVGADLIEVGGPRMGDRLAKYERAGIVGCHLEDQV
jgi:enolase